MQTEVCKQDGRKKDKRHTSGRRQTQKRQSHHGLVDKNGVLLAPPDQLGKCQCYGERRDRFHSFTALPTVWRRAGPQRADNVHKYARALAFYDDLIGTLDESEDLTQTRRIRVCATCAENQGKTILSWLFRSFSCKA